MNNKKKKALLSLLVVVVCAFSFFCGYLTRSSTYQKETATIDYIISMYKKYYYEQSGVDKDVVDAFCDGLLDQYSDYYTKEEYNVVYQVGQGIKQGIGISCYANSLAVGKVAYNSPAERAGIRVGDVITAITYNGEKTLTPDYDAFIKVYDLIDENVDFTLTLSSDGAEREVTLQRSQFIETYVRYFDTTGEYGFNDTDKGMAFVRIGDNARYDLQGKENLAVIEYTGFQATASGLNGSVEQMNQAMRVFKERNKTDLILDLRNNGGGKMNILCDVVSHFIDQPTGSKPLICYAQDKYGKKENYYSTSVDYAEYGFKSIQILANAGSASASEAFIGAVLDYDSKNVASVILEPTYSRVIVGDRVEYVAEYRTYGKGIMQTTYENVTGGAIKLTTAGLFWPLTDVTIHGVGVTDALNQSAYNGVEKVKNASTNGCVYDAVSSK